MVPPLEERGLPLVENLGPLSGQVLAVVAQGVDGAGEPLGVRDPAGQAVAGVQTEPGPCLHDAGVRAGARHVVLGELVGQGLDDRDGEHEVPAELERQSVQLLVGGQLGVIRE